jgi:hypothetical protein
MNTKNEKQIDSCFCRNDNIQQSQNDLHKQFVYLGRERNKITYKLLALLPEINRLEIYKKYGCATIIEYAGRFAGLSKSVVLKTLNLHENLKDKPCLKKAIETEGVHKVALIAKIATPVTDKAFADKVKNMSTSAIQTLSRELRQEAVIDKNVFAERLNQERKCCAASIKMTIELDDEMQLLFLKLKKVIGKDLNNKETLKIMLKMLTKQQNSNSVQNFCAENRVEPKAATTNDHTKKPKSFSRYIPAQIKQQILQKTNNKCSYPNCNKPVDVFHHTNRFSDLKSHESIIGFCKVHHEFAHNGIIENEENSRNLWNLKISDKEETLLADRLYRRYRHSVN